MKILDKFYLIILILFNSFGHYKQCYDSTFSNFDSIEKNDIVNQLNDFRNQIKSGIISPLTSIGSNDMRVLYWDDELATLAQNYANLCPITYSNPSTRLYKGLSNVGETIYFSQIEQPQPIKSSAEVKQIMMSGTIQLPQNVYIVKECQGLIPSSTWTANCHYYFLFFQILQIEVVPPDETFGFTVQVNTAGALTCQSFCNKYNFNCLTGQDDKSNSCDLITGGTTNNGCSNAYQRQVYFVKFFYFKKKICSCADKAFLYNNPINYSATNYFITPNTTQDIEQSISSWKNQQSNYVNKLDFDTFKDFAQIIYGPTVRIGCGISYKQGKQGSQLTLQKILICNYWPMIPINSINLFNEANKCSQQNCDACKNNNNKCETCEVNYYLQIDNTTCLQNCQDPSFQVNSKLFDYYCKLCIPFCKQCNNLNSCISCQYNASLDLNFQCCNITNCEICANTLSCSQCIQNYFKNQKGQCCSQQYCTQCNDSQVCEKCESSYFLQKSTKQCFDYCETGTKGIYSNDLPYNQQNMGNICNYQECPIGKNINLKNICTGCHSDCQFQNCTVGESSANCTLCKDQNKYLNYSQINLQYGNCIDYSIGGCFLNYFVSKTISNIGISVCQNDCPQRSYEDSQTTQCLICPNGCQTCSKINNNIQCQVCNQSLILKPDLSDCIKDCMIDVGQNYFPDIYDQDQSQNICKICSQNCKTCNSTNTTCLSCDQTNASTKYLQVIQKICISSCPIGFMENNIEFTCRQCHTDCISCSGTNLGQCLQCIDIQLYFQFGFCVNTCSQEYIPNNQQGNKTCDACSSKINYFLNEKNICNKCPINCLTCFEQDNKLQCTSCVDKNYLLRSDQADCISNCQIQAIYGLYKATFANNSSQQICKYCNSNCKTCIDNEFNCTSCNQEENNIQYLHVDNHICITSCPDFYFPYIIQNQQSYCLKCHSDCLKCNDEKQSSCLICSIASKFLNFGKCVIKCNQDQITDLNTMSCQKCSSDQTYILSYDKSTCLKIIEIHINLFELIEHSLYYIEIDKYWKDLFDEMVINKQLANVSLTQLNWKTDFQYQISANISEENQQLLQNKTLKSDSYYFSLYLEFSQGIKILENSNIILTLNKELGQKTTFQKAPQWQINPNQVQLKIRQYEQCKIEMYYNYKTKLCQDRTRLTQTLKNSFNNPKQLILEFEGDAPEYFFSNLSKYIDLYEISSLDKYQYNYTLNRISTKKFEINLDFKQDIINNPKASIIVKLPLEMKNDPKFYLENNKSSIALNDYYKNHALSQLEQNFGKAGGKLGRYLGFITSIMNGGGGGAMIILGIIELLKYQNINYPPNLKPLFESVQPFPPNLYFKNAIFKMKNEDYGILPEKFEYYNISPYYINNMAESIVQVFSFYLFAYFLWIVALNIKNPRNYVLKFFYLLWSFFYKIIAFNMAYFLIFCRYMGSSLYCIVNLTFMPNSSGIFIQTIYKKQILKVGIFNSLLGILNIFLNLFLMIHLIVIIKICDRIDLEFKYLGYQNRLFLHNQDQTYFRKQPLEYLMFKFLPKTQKGKKDYMIQHTILFNDYKNEKPVQKYYIIIELLRISLIAWMIGFMPSWPVLQTFFNSFILIGFFVFLIIKRPHKSTLLFVLIILQEICVIIAYVCSIILAIFDKYKILRIETRARIGKTIGLSCLGIMYLVVITMALTAGRVLIDIFKAQIKFRREQQKQKNDKFIRQNVKELKDDVKQVVDQTQKINNEMINNLKLKASILIKEKVQQKIQKQTKNNEKNKELEIKILKDEIKIFQRNNPNLNYKEEDIGIKEGEHEIQNQHTIHLANDTEIPDLIKGQQDNYQLTGLTQKLDKFTIQRIKKGDQNAIKLIKSKNIKLNQI